MKRLLYPILAGLATLVGCNTGVQKEAIAVNTDTTSVKHPEWSANAVIYEVNTRQYTPEGTFKAFSTHIPRLKDLGVDILWLMPIHPISELNRKGTLGSYYAVKDYKGINPEFGTFEDFKAVVDSAHAAGMKVIIDWVPNHTGCDNAWVAEHPEYYELNDSGKMYGPYDWTDVYKLDYSKPETRAAMIDAMQYWLREADIDGFRCDVAGNVPVDFWNEARPALDSVKSDIFMLAEAAMPELNHEAFDMSYNWPLSNVFSAISATAGQYTFKAPGQDEPNKFPETHAAAIDSLLADQAMAYPVGTIMMNMITNHDYNSWEGTEFDRLGNLVPAFAVLSYTLPGMPLMYTGQEMGLNHPFEFFEKDFVPEWNTDNDYFTFYRTLNDLKHMRPELAAGIAGAPVKSYAVTDEDLYVFGRSVDGCTTLVGVNLGNSTRKLEFKSEKPSIENLYNLFTAEKVEALPDELTAGEYFVYVSK